MSRMIIIIYVLKQVIIRDPYKTQYLFYKNKKKDSKKRREKKEENKPDLK